ncbi:hypothetical protein [Streptomyces jumonjinensis]|uniref:Lipoprotein n=1 Tax=Streptomyces jumonjinensis TaxID=1945 RepID=A0A646KMZ4_STRJU|nr:hypothetical protein [Streptomyces jumonjinensis]MQT03291.1 hypothetical protein [Streptomyces jumonjinensis]
MFPTQKRAIAQTLLAASVLLVGGLLAGCSDETDRTDTASPTKDSSGSGPEASPTSAFERGLAYSKCMRENGVPKFPDPQQDGQGVRLTPGEGVDMGSQSYKSAEEACRDKAPQGTGQGQGGTLDSAKVSAWAKCLRENGLTKLPDPEINGSNMNIDIQGAGITPGGPEFTKAMSACQSKYPGGGLMMGGGGGGQ